MLRCSCGYTLQVFFLFLWACAAIPRGMPSLFNLLATDLEIDMRDYWTPDEYFLARLKAENIAKIIAKTNTNHLFGSLIGFKKKDMVSILVKHFKKLSGQDICEGKDIDAKNWLPEGMHFPAIDPDEPPIDDAELDKVA